MVILFLADGFEEAEAVFPVDILRRAGVDVKTASIKEEKRVRSSRNIVIEADLALNEVEELCAKAEAGAKEEDAELEGVILPGGMPGAENLKNAPIVRRLALACAARGRLLAAICAAPMVYGELGLLSGREAVCYPGFESHLHGAAIKKRAVVASGNCITAIGPGAAIEFGLKIVEYLKDKKTADRIASALLPV